MTADVRPLTDKQSRFAEEYISDMNATQAATRAGYSAKTAASQGERLLRNVEIQKAIAQARAAMSRRTEITADKVLERFWAIVTADPRELIEYRRSCCRYCHGKDFGYQRTRAELAKERSTWEAKQAKSSKEIFDEQGGEGYNATKAPHADCPECFGEGVERAFVHDTRTYSASARALYAGVKVTKDGIDVKMHDQTAALVSVARHLGMFDEKNITPADPSEVARAVRGALRSIAEADGTAA